MRSSSVNKTSLIAIFNVNLDNMKLNRKQALITTIDFIVALTVHAICAWQFQIVSMDSVIYFSLFGGFAFVIFGHITGVYLIIVSHMEAGNELMIAVAAMLAAFLSVTIFNGINLFVIGVLGLALFASVLIPRLASKTQRTIAEGKADSGGQKVAIYGAGEIGVQLASALEHSREHHVVFFFDDNPELEGRLLLGHPILQPTEVKEKLEYHKISEVFLALPGITQSRRKEIVEALQFQSVRLRSVPSLQDILTPGASVADLQDIELGDLLSRMEVEPRIDLIEKSVKNKVVMVTGAGGSIGSELCRQIATVGPKKLIMFELSEHNLYQIDREIRGCHSEWEDTKIIAVLGSVCDDSTLQSVFENHNVDVIFHAAAYKHVPLVESNPLEAVRNNVFGTRTLAKRACSAGVAKLVLISTDKAVRPTNVMGATKRLAEQVLQSLSGLNLEGQENPQLTQFSIVRFGNVLGSAGSVVPLFRKQISRGGPVTVTHSDITRFIMTIPEAVQLVLQASSLATDGDVCVLDMGEPVKIRDLAEQIIRLSGFCVKDEKAPNGDIEIRYIGLRPGEKLFEELFIGDDIHSTAHPKILRVRETCLSKKVLDDFLVDLEYSVEERNEAKMHAILADTVDGYTVPAM